MKIETHFLEVFNEMIVIIQNIPTPYRVAFFDALWTECRERGIGFKVLYCALNEYNRHWKIDLAEINHPYEILSGLHPKICNATFHINPVIGCRIRELCPKILICGGAWNMPTNWHALLSISKETTSVFWSEGHADAVMNPRGPIAWLRQFVLRRFKVFAVPNQKGEKWIKSESGRSPKFVVLPNTVREEFYRKQPSDRESARAKLGISYDEKILLQVSQLEPRKGVMELINAYSNLDDAIRTSTTLVFLGEGSLRSDVDSSIKDLRKGMILAPGHQSSEQVRQWLHAADWFVLNTHSDPNPLTPIEASFAGIPLLLSRKAGNIDELLIDGRTGIRIQDPSDPSNELFLALTMNRKDSVSLGNNSQQNAEKQFTRREVAKALLDQLHLETDRIQNA